jgi:hypothetical protein
LGRAGVAIPGVLQRMVNAGRLDGGLDARVDRRAGFNLNELIDDWELQRNATGAIMAGILASMQAFDVPGRIPQANPVNRLTWRFVGAGVGGADLVVNSDNPDDIIDDGERAWFNDIVTAYTHAVSWIFDLVGANQIKTLKEGNVANYFMGQGNTRVNARPILNIIKGLSGMLPSIATNVTLSNMDWVRYHTTATSTPGLLRRCYNEWPREVQRMVRDATRNTLAAAEAAPWNKTLADAIPRNFLVWAAIYLKVTRRYPDDWYQGNKALADQSALYIGNMTRFFNRIEEIRAEAADFTLADDVAGAVALIPDGMNTI